MVVLGKLLFIVFGSKVREKDYGRVYAAECPHCNNQCYYRAVKVRKWWHIYWIPLIPREKDYRIECPVCQMGVTVSKEGFTAAKKMAEITRQNMDGQISAEEYEKQLQRFESLFSTDGYKTSMSDVSESELDGSVEDLRDRHDDDDANRGFH